MDLRMTNVNGQVREVISEADYANKWKMYNDNPSICSESAVEITDVHGDKFILPFRNKMDDRPGIYPDGSIYFFKTPTDETRQDYLSENLEVTDFSDVTTVKDFLNKNSQIRDMETSALSDKDTVFIPQISNTDSPEMKLMKQAIASKQIDLTKYAPRFGSNFLNDRRVLKSEAITIKKLVSICEKLDIEAELTLRNSRSDVANPMPDEISVILTGAGGDDA